LGELVKNLVGVDVRAVVVGDGDSSRGLASVDTLASVCDVTLLRARIVAGAGASRGLVGVTSWAKVD
jgi:hypothetical protein